MKKRMPKNFERLLVEWRAGLGLSQAKMADEIGVSQKTVHAWESGKSRATKVMEFRVLEWAHERGLVDSSPKSDWREEE